MVLCTDIKHTLYTFLCWNIGQMFKPFRRECWRRSSDFLRNQFRFPDSRLAYLLQIFHVFIVGVLKYTVKSMVIDNVPPP